MDPNSELSNLVTLLLPVLFFLARLLLKDRADKYESTFKAGVEVAYFLVNNLSKHTDNKIDDKAAVALDALRKYMGTAGAPLKQVDEERAKLLFQAMHGQGK